MSGVGGRWPSSASRVVVTVIFDDGGEGGADPDRRCLLSVSDGHVASFPLFLAHAARRVCPASAPIETLSCTLNGLPLYDAQVLRSDDVVHISATRPIPPVAAVMKRLNVYGPGIRRAHRSSRALSTSLSSAVRATTHTHNVVTGVEESKSDPTTGGKDGDDADDAGPDAVECCCCAGRMSPSSPSAMFLGCTHTVHVSCLASHITSTVDDGEPFGATVPCPSRGCSFTLPEDNIAHAVGRDAFKASADRVSAEDARLAEQLYDEEVKRDAEFREAATFDCPICFDALSVEDGVTLCCDHRVCPDCLNGYINSKVGEKAVDEAALVCPVPKCGTSITPQEIAGWVPPDVFDRYLRFVTDVSLDRDPNAVRCPRCDLITLFPDRDADPKVWTNAHCPNPNCGAKFCADCKDSPHDGTCEDFRQWKLDNGKGDVAFEAMMKEKDWVRCPHCHMPCELQAGCFFMTCNPPCGANFCFICGVKLTKEQHYSHYPDGPWTKRCDGRRKVKRRGGGGGGGARGRVAGGRAGLYG